MEKYPIALNDERIGVATVETKGLYTEILCRCSVLGENLCKVQMVFPDKTINLGVLVREGMYFTACKRVPTKSLGSGCPSFCAIEKKAHISESMCRVYADQPFPYLAKIAEGHLYIQDGLYYISFSSGDIVSS